jgi:hypothetical protein
LTNSEPILPVAPVTRIIGLLLMVGFRAMNSI